MLRVAEGLRAVSATIDEIESRIAGPAGGVLGAGGVSGFNLINVAKVFSQGVEFASAAGRQRLVDKLALEVLAEKAADRKFVVGVMGTSVTAGHDNWFNESWSQVLGQWLGPALAPAGVGVEVRNHAIGGNRYETSAYCAQATVGDDVDLFFFEFNMIFHGPADAFEPFIRNILSLPSRPVFCHMLGFDAQNPEVPQRADETGALVKGKADGIDLAKGLVLGKYRGRTNAGKYLDWKEWVPAESLTGLPAKEAGPYAFKRPPHYWREGRTSLFEYYARHGMHWSDPDG